MPSSSDCSKLGHCTSFFYKINRGSVPAGEFSSLQFHCFRIIRTKIIIMSSVENFLNRSYPLFSSTTATTNVMPVERNLTREEEKRCLKLALGQLYAILVTSLS